MKFLLLLLIFISAEAFSGDCSIKLESCKVLRFNPKNTFLEISYIKNNEMSSVLYKLPDNVDGASACYKLQDDLNKCVINPDIFSDEISTNKLL